MHIFFDYDGVLQDTWTIIEEEKRKMEDYYKTSWEFFSTLDWHTILRKAEHTEDAVRAIYKCQQSFHVSIVTSFSSFGEAREKAEYIPRVFAGVPLILVPYGVEKNQLVSASGNILIDDNTDNITAWENAGGMGMHFRLDRTEKTALVNLVDSLISGNCGMSRGKI